MYPTCLTIVTLTCTVAIYFCRYKGEAEYNAPPKTVFEYVEPLPNGPRPKWDKNMKKIEILKWIDEPVSVFRNLKMVWWTGKWICVMYKKFITSTVWLDNLKLQILSYIKN